MDHSQFYKTEFSIYIDETQPEPYIVHFKMTFLDYKFLERLKNVHGNLYIRSGWLPFIGNHLHFSKDWYFNDDKRLYDSFGGLVPFPFRTIKEAEEFIKKSPGRVNKLFDRTLKNYVKLKDEKSKLEMVSGK
jgi:hypothetical protein